MFRSVTGFKAQYHYLTLYVAADFDEWKVVLQGQGSIIIGVRQFTEAKAKECACKVAVDYLQNEKHEDLPPLESVEWTPFRPGEWLQYRP